MIHDYSSKQTTHRRWWGVEDSTKAELYYFHERKRKSLILIHRVFLHKNRRAFIFILIPWDKHLIQWVKRHTKAKGLLQVVLLGGYSRSRLCWIERLRGLERHDGKCRFTPSPRSTSDRLRSILLSLTSTSLTWCHGLQPMGFFVWNSLFRERSHSI